MAKGKNHGAGSSAPGNDGENVGAGNGDGGNAGGLDSIAGIPVSDPGAVTDTGAGASGASGDGSDGAAPKRKRGRPAGSGNGGAKSGSREKAASSTVTGIEKLLFGIHAGIATATGAQELNLSREEASLLANSVAEVASHYDTTIDPKTMAWVGLFGVLGSIYGPRVAAMRIRAKMEKASKAPGPLAGDAPVAAPMGNAMAGIPGFDSNITAH